MRKHLLGLLLIGGLAGCTSEWDTERAEGSRSSPTAKADAEPTQQSLAAVRGSQSSFASLPDRGELLQYASDRQVRKSGAYTHHPVAISEAHALNAIAKGEMRINLPSGTPLDLEYDRYEEQPDGNWTWIGRNEDGSSAVLTFGEKAVFGLVSSGGQNYRVRTDGTGAWIVETNRALLAGGGGDGRRTAGPDFLVPPSGQTGSAGIVATPNIRQAAVGATAMKAVDEKAGGAVIDVLLGYSNGLAARVGSQSGAATLMASRVALTNNAYAASGVSMRLRLVHAMQVTYADTSDNQDALEKLTGFDVGTQDPTPIPVDPAFTALRNAREEYGADLVALVRAYREPEQDGCGIAWLLGINQTGIQVARDAEFAYAVVSDGTDVDESDNNTYFCSEYALAHELGHLMGQAHNSENAAGRAGAHAYSFGYREAASTGFFTIMAYPLDDAQAVNEIGNFANPAVNVSGRPTGTANADNVRSMNVTMPIVSQFRAVKVPLSGVASDFNGDGVSDILWRNSSTGQSTIWRSGNNGTQTVLPSVGNTWQVAGVGDFNGDGVSDILWRNSVNGQNTVWRSGDSATQTTLSAVGGTWQIVGVGDFNGDGASDILWRNSVNGQNTIWRSGNNGTQTPVAAVGNTWQVVGVGDFNGDGVSDILWRNSVNGQNTIWRSGNNATQTVLAGAANAWRVVGIGDFNGDAVSDILWRNPSTGQNSIWRSGNNGTQTALPTVGSTWQVAGVGDFNGDGVSDILWRNSVNGQNTIWRSANNATQTFVAAVDNMLWRVMPPQ